MAKKRMGRPPSKNPKNRVIRARMTTDEYAKVERLAAERGITMSDALREAVALRLCWRDIETISVRLDSVIATVAREGLDANTIEYVQNTLEDIIELISLSKILETKGESLKEADKLSRELMFVADPTQEDVDAGIQHTKEVMGDD